MKFKTDIQNVLGFEVGFLDKCFLEGNTSKG